MPDSTSHFYLCTGFHRSGTSLLAQSLAKGGMHMGADLMGASFSNPLGHVEDMPIVRLHDQLLHINGSDWRYCDNRQLIKPSWLLNDLACYMNTSKQAQGFCGVKDPRAAFFLDDWQAAGEGTVRYVLVYRHWSTAVSSIFNRAARHLTNSAAPIPANIVNYDFWKQPLLAVDMWLATNKRIIEFYRHHQADCILISQEAFVENNQAVQNIASKIDLPVSCLSSGSFNAKLMTNQASSILTELYSAEKLAELEAVWQELQSLADAATANHPEFTKVTHNASAKQLGIHCQAGAMNKPQAAKFDVSSLTWQQALAFLACVPGNLFTVSLIDDLLSRPYSSTEHYQTLAKIALKNGLLLHSKLCNMRAMHIEQGTWHIEQWSLFIEGNITWYGKNDAELPQSIPFSLQPLTEFYAVKQGDVPDVTTLAWQSLRELLENSSSARLAALLTNVLLYRPGMTCSEVNILASIALRHKFFSLAEFSFIKALRHNYDGGLILGLGDMYLSQNMHAKALQCYVEANDLTPYTGAIIARMANSHFLLGDVFQAKPLLAEAAALQPNNRVVKLCQKRLANYELVTNNSIKQGDDFGMPTVSHYEQVVSLTQEDQNAGVLLDVYSQRCSFILRNNRQWLMRGMKEVSPIAADYMSSLIYKHWQKVWGTAVVNYALRLPTASAKPFSNQQNSTDTKIAVYIELTEARALDMLLSFMRNIGTQIDCIIAGTVAIKDAVVVKCERLGVNILYETVSSDNQWLDIHLRHLVDYDVVCKIHGVESNQYPEATNWCLQQLFCLLGDQNTVNNTMANMYAQDNIGMVIPSYHPNLTKHFINKENLQKIGCKAQELGVALDATFYAYPAGGMFWYRPKALDVSYLKSLVIENSADLNEVLPAILKANNFSTQVSHMLNTDSC